jgi:hypothetical protein
MKTVHTGKENKFIKKDFKKKIGHQTGFLTYIGRHTSFIRFIPSFGFVISPVFEFWSFS